MVSRLLSLGALVPVVLLLSACTGDEEPPGGVPAAVTQALALLDGDAEPQRTVLELAATERRDITFEEYRQAMEGAVECINSSGPNNFEVRTVGQDGPSTELSVGGTTASLATIDAVMGSCLHAHSDAISYAYFSRAEAVEARLQTATRFLPGLVACVRDKGVLVADDATLEEVLEGELQAFPDAPPGEGCACTTGLAQEVGAYCG